MKVIALLCFYDENPAWLSATVASCARFCDHVVASDGGYFLFPGARPHSGIEAHDAISQTAYACGIGCTIHAPATVWYGNEVEKRNHLVQTAMQIAEPGVDWLFRVDADEVVTDVPFDIRDRLAASVCDVGTVSMWWRSVLGPEANAEVVRDFDQQGEQSGLRFLLRAVPGLHVAGAHNFYLAGDRVLYGRSDMHAEEPADDFNDLRIEHRHVHRNAARNRRADEFNLRRDDLGIERVWQPHMENINGDVVTL